MNEQLKKAIEDLGVQFSPEATEKFLSALGGLIEQTAKAQAEELNKAFKLEYAKQVEAKASEFVENYVNERDKKTLELLEESKKEIEAKYAVELQNLEKLIVGRTDVLMQESVSVALNDETSLLIAKAQVFEPLVSAQLSLFEEHFVGPSTDGGKKLGEMNQKLSVFQEQLDVLKTNLANSEREIAGQKARADRAEVMLMVEQKTQHLLPNQKEGVLVMFAESNLADVSERIDGVIQLFEESNRSARIDQTAPATQPTQNVVHPALGGEENLQLHQEQKDAQAQPEAPRFAPLGTSLKSLLTGK